MKNKYILNNGKEKNKYYVLCGDEIVGEIYARASTFAATYKNDSSDQFEYLGNNYNSPYQARRAVETAYEKALKEHPERFRSKSSQNIQELPLGDASEFYPTPNSLIGKMLSGIDWTRIETVLEPEAGKGDIAHAIKKACKKRYYERILDIDCIEKDPYLQHILRGEGFRVIHDDFLTFCGRKKYDLIVMNPPFSNADEHLLKALEVQKNGGSIICLLNAETLKNPYTKRRQVLLQKLAEVNAQIKYFKHMFKKAERKTDVEVALVKVFIPAENGESKIFTELKKSMNYKEPETFEKQELAPSDIIEMMVRQYNLEVDASLELIREYRAMQPYIMNTFDKSAYGRDAILTLRVGDTHELKINLYLRNVRMKYWEALFSRKEFTGKLTSELQSKYMNMVSKLADYDFTVYNIERVHAEMNAEMVQGIKNSILALFDKFSEEHAWYPECQKNIHFYNGWKTNKAHKVGKKVIIPINGAFSTYSWKKDELDTYLITGVLSDVEKVFNYLSGDMNAPCEIGNIFEIANRLKQTKDIETKYFFVTFYKKGTAHITFKDERLVEAFNIFAARNKNWLPPCYGKVQYEEMQPEEKAVIDDFQGKTAYNDVLAHKAQMLYEVPHQLMLTA